MMPENTDFDDENVEEQVCDLMSVNDKQLISMRPSFVLPRNKVDYVYVPKTHKSSLLMMNNFAFN